MSVDFNLIKKMLIFEEGIKFYIYDDVTGQKVKAPIGNLTGAIGHNFESSPLSDKIINAIFEEDVSIAIGTCNSIFINYESLSQARKLALINMSFNLGIKRLSTFKKMIEFILKLDFESAAVEISDSLWAIQLKKRAARVRAMIIADTIPEEYLN